MALQIGAVQLLPGRPEKPPACHGALGRRQELPGAQLPAHRVKLGDLVFFYHSNIAEPAIVGIAEVVKEGYPDWTAFDPENVHFDPRSTPEKPLWYMVDVRFLLELPHPLTLARLKGIPTLSGMPLLSRSRLSVQPVGVAECAQIMELAQIALPPE